MWYYLSWNILFSHFLLYFFLILLSSVLYEKLLFVHPHSMQFHIIYFNNSIWSLIISLIKMSKIGSDIYIKSAKMPHTWKTFLVCKRNLICHMLFRIMLYTNLHHYKLFSFALKSWMAVLHFVINNLRFIW